MLPFVCIICAVIVTSMVYLVSHVLSLNAYVKHIPRVPLTMFKSFLTQTKTPTEFYEFLQNIFHLYGGMASLWFGPNLAVVCADPEDMRTVFMSKDCVDKPYLYRLMRALGNGIFSATSHVWRSDRKALNAVFKLSILKTYEPIFNRRSIDLAMDLENFVDQPEFVLAEHILRCNFNSVLDTNFGYDCESLDCNHAKFMNKMSRLAEISITRGSSLFLHSSFIYRLTSLYAEEMEIFEDIATIAPKVISNALQKRKVDLSNGMAPDCDDTKPMILIDKLLNLEETGLMDRQRILDQINTFVVAGTDTSGFTILNMLLLLSMNPTMQDRVYEELRANIENYDYIDYDTMSKLEYLDRALKESMRLLTLNFILLRITEADVELKKCTVPKGTILIMNLFELHRSEKSWGPTALEFDPDRFLPEAVAQRHPFAFLPFSTGPRNCIGFKYALNSMKVMLCHLLLRYKFSTSIQMEDISFKFAFLLKLNNKYMFKLEKRPVN